MSVIVDRTNVLGALGPKGWYIDHLGKKTTCWCTVAAPELGCDTGEALFRLRLSILNAPPADPVRPRRRRR